MFTLGSPQPLLPTNTVSHFVDSLLTVLSNRNHFIQIPELIFQQTAVLCYKRYRVCQPLSSPIVIVSDRIVDVVCDHFRRIWNPATGNFDREKSTEASHVHREMLYLCEIVEDYGSESEPVQITFGKLFNIYEHISDKVVGILLRARKHGMVDFEGEMLFQRRDDHVFIKLLLSGQKLKDAIKEHQANAPPE